MGNFTIISAVTTILQNILQREVQDEVGTILNVSARAPHTIKSDPDDNGLNIYLFLVTNNSGYSNLDLPRRDSNYRLISNPLLGLDLHYLLTPFTNDNDEILSQQILASTMRVLHENSVLTKSLLKKEFELIEASDPNNKILKSGLKEQVESVKIMHKPLSVEELTKLWSSYSQTNYRLSIAYLAMPILIESIKEPVVPLSVQERKIFVSQMKPPVIERIEPTILQWESNNVKRRIEIIGKNLNAEIMRVVIGKELIIPLDLLVEISENKVIAELPEELGVGSKRIQIVHGFTDEDNCMDNFDTQHLKYESNSLPLVITPRILTTFPIQVLIDTKFNVQFEPPLEEDQKVQVMIGEESFPQNTVAGQTTISIDTSGFSPGRFLFRLRVDGADSLLVSGPDNTYVGPEIVVTEQ